VSELVNTVLHIEM